MEKEIFIKSVEKALSSIDQLDISPLYHFFHQQEIFSNFPNFVCHVASLLKLKRDWTKQHGNHLSDVNFKVFILNEIEDSISTIICEFKKEYYRREFSSLSITELKPMGSKLLSLHPVLFN